MNTDYHHGDRPLGLFWCCGQMKTSDQEHLLMGRVRSWDGLIVLRRLPVSPLLLISHHPPSPTSFIPYRLEPVSFHYLFSIRWVHRIP